MSKTTKYRRKTVEKKSKLKIKFLVYYFKEKKSFCLILIENKNALFTKLK